MTDTRTDTSKQTTDVHDYYASIDENTEFKTGACCSGGAPEHLKPYEQNIHEEVRKRFFGCAPTVPEALEGMRIIDAGSGRGYMSFLLSQLVGERGLVVGVDMVKEAINFANSHVSYHMDAFTYKKGNVVFMHGSIEKLPSIGVLCEPLDIITSNCVLNLSPNKKEVLKETYRALKDGGEFYISDVFTTKRLPESLAQDKEILGECLGSAMYIHDFEQLAKDVGFLDPRLLDIREIPITDERIQQTIEDQAGDVTFYSATYRLLKLPELEYQCEDYGHRAMYIGGIEFSEDRFKLDNHHCFEKMVMVNVCRNTYRMLNETRFKKYFSFERDADCHLGKFDACSTNVPEEALNNSSCC